MRIPQACLLFLLVGDGLKAHDVKTLLCPDGETVCLNGDCKEEGVSGVFQCECHVNGVISGKENPKKSKMCQAKVSDTCRATKFGKAPRRESSFGFCINQGRCRKARFGDVPLCECPLANYMGAHCEIPVVSRVLQEAVPVPTAPTMTPSPSRSPRPSLSSQPSQSALPSISNFPTITNIPSVTSFPTHNVYPSVSPFPTRFNATVAPTPSAVLGVPHNDPTSSPTTNVPSTTSIPTSSQYPTAHFVRPPSYPTPRPTIPPLDPAGNPVPLDPTNPNRTAPTGGGGSSGGGRPGTTGTMDGSSSDTKERNGLKTGGIIGIIFIVAALLFFLFLCVGGRGRSQKENLVEDDGNLQLTETFRDEGRYRDDDVDEDDSNKKRIWQRKAKKPVYDAQGATDLI